MRARIGNVCFLNAAPLARGLADAPGIELVADTPSRVAAGLESGTLDVGLVPVVEAARLRLFVAAGMGVAALGPVRSVLLVSRVPARDVGVLALDPASRTSAALVRLLLARVHGRRPRETVGPEAGEPVPPGADAGLVIGDRALVFQATDDLRVIDLAGWWWEVTGLPFVFAVWAGRDPALVGRLLPHLVAARDRGLAERDRIADEAETRFGVPCGVARSYLHDAVRYDVGEAERVGLDHFLGELKARALIEPGAELRFVG